MKTQTLLISVAGLAVAAGAWAQPFKCVGPDGKVTFSDQKCETAPPPKPAAAPEKPAEDPAALDRARIKALEAVMSDPKSNAEQRTAALLEASNIRRGIDAKMKPADRERRDELTKELANPDPAKRAAALRDLRLIYQD